MASPNFLNELRRADSRNSRNAKFITILIDEKVERSLDQAFYAGGVERMGSLVQGIFESASEITPPQATKEVISHAH